MQPFEIIKVRLQTQSGTNNLYNGIFDCLTKIVKNEGFFALYKGNWSLNFRKSYTLHWCRYLRFCEIWTLRKLQENLGSKKRIEQRRIIVNSSKEFLCIPGRLHQLFPRGILCLIKSALSNTPVSEFKSKSLQLIRFTQGHWTLWLKSSSNMDSRDWTEVRHPLQSERQLDLLYTLPQLNK